MKTKIDKKITNENFNLKYPVIPGTITNVKNLQYIIPSVYFIVLSFISFTYHKIGDYGVETDFYWEYVPQAKAVLNGMLLIDAYRGPLYQAVLAVFSLPFSGDFFNAGIFINIICASLILLLVFKIIEIISNKEIALITVIFTATNQYFIKYSYSCSTDMLFMVMYFLSVFFILKSDLQDKKMILLSGLFAALAYLTRYTALSLIIVMLLCLSVQIIKKLRTRNLKLNEELFLKIKNLFLFFVPVILLITAWGIFCLNYTGRFFYNDNFLNTAYTVYKPEDLSNARWSAEYAGNFHSFSDVIFTDFGLFVKRIFIENFTGYFVKDMSILLPWYLGIITSAGLVFFIFKYKKINSKTKFFFFLNFAFYFFTLLIFYSERFSLPVLPFYIYLMSNILYFSFSKIFSGKKGSVPAAGFILLVSILIINCYSGFSFIKEDISSGPKDVLSAGEWVKNNYNDGLKGKKIMARKPHIAYYTNSVFIPLVSAYSYEELISKIIQSNTDYFFISTTELSSKFNLTKVLFDKNNPPAELEPVYRAPDNSCVLFKIKR